MATITKNRKFLNEPKQLYLKPESSENEGQNSGLYNLYQPPLALASMETFFTHQQNKVTCQIKKDTNSYYATPICI